MPAAPAGVTGRELSGVVLAEHQLAKVTRPRSPPDWTARPQAQPAHEPPRPKTPNAVRGDSDRVASPRGDAQVCPLGSTA